MMKAIGRRTDEEMAEREALKIARAAIRLKYSVLADRELNEKLPLIQETVIRALNEGRPFALDVRALFTDEGA